MCHLNRGRGVGNLGESKWFLEKMNEWALQRIHGRYNSYEKVCLGVVLTASLLSCDKSQSSLVDEIPGERGFMTIEILLEDWSLDR